MADEKAANPFQIDEARLDEEWLRQPQLTRKAGYREADARHELAMAKAHLDVTEARLRISVRQNPSEHGLKEKPTEGSIGEVVLVMKEYQEVLAEVNELKHDLDIMAADVAAMIDRRKALERLVELLALDYYAGREPRGASPAAREQIKERTRRAVRGSADTE